MADEVVRILADNLKELLDHHPDLLKDGARSQIESIQKDLRVFNEFLNVSWEKRRNHDAHTENIVEKISKVVNEVEDIIDTFVNQAMIRNRSSFLFRHRKSPVDLNAISQRVTEVGKIVDETKAHIGIAKLSVQDESLRFQNWAPRKKDVVGFEDVTKDLVTRLITETDNFDVISVVGMLGLGKTTVAWKVFRDPEIMFNFPIRIWLSISQEFSDKDIFLSILKEFTTIDKNILSKDGLELADMVIAFLDRGRFLIVFDDVWEIPHWRRLSAAIPFHNNRGKVLITRRNENLGKLASHPNPVINLRFFTLYESWQLLRLEALGNLDCPPELVNIGQKIASSCNGQPLAIVLIGGILAAKLSFSNIRATEKEWEKISTSVSTYINEDFSGNSMKKLISLSYDRLPPHLRSCFRYFGSFPEGFEIPVSTLIRLWIAEGFVPHIEGRTLEETAEKYLEELINVNLVQREKLKYNGKTETCRISDILRDFCSAEAARDNLAKEIRSTNGIFSPPVSEIDKYRRLSIHSHCQSFIASKPSCRHARSFVCFPNDASHLSEEQGSKIIQAFKFLRVLDAKPLKFEKLDTLIFQFVHMRYLALSCNFSILPAKFGMFWNMQTLIVGTTSRTLQVKADIWKMSKLRHFKTNAAATLPKPGKSSEHGEELQTLGMISEESCTAEVIRRASNLKKLGIRGRLALLFEGKAGDFYCLGKMQHIEKLKLVNDVFPYPARDRPVGGLPQPDRFPSGLTSLTLSATFLDWDAMAILGSLRKLEVLKLREFAFTGITWNAVDGHFQCLEFLQIECTDLTVWNASSHHYPRLRSLVLRNCEKLSEIPVGLADIQSFQNLELYMCRNAAASAKAIGEQKEKTQGDSYAFRLSIFPLTA